MNDKWLVGIDVLSNRLRQEIDLCSDEPYFNFKNFKIVIPFSSLIYNTSTDQQNRYRSFVLVANFVFCLGETYHVIYQTEKQINYN